MKHLILFISLISIVGCGTAYKQAHRQQAQQLALCGQQTELRNIASCYEQGYRQPWAGKTNPDQAVTEETINLIWWAVAWYEECEYLRDDCGADAWSYHQTRDYINQAASWHHQAVLSSHRDRVIAHRAWQNNVQQSLLDNTAMYQRWFNNRNTVRADSRRHDLDIREAQDW